MARINDQCRGLVPQLVTLAVEHGQRVAADAVQQAMFMDRTGAADAMACELLGAARVLAIQLADATGRPVAEVLAELPTLMEIDRAN